MMKDGPRQHVALPISIGKTATASLGTLKSSVGLSRKSKGTGNRVSLSLAVGSEKKIKERFPASTSSELYTGY